jgi:hypothetical protein
MKIRIKNILPATVFVLSLTGLSSCTSDLDVDNINPQQVATYNQNAIFNKVYANMVLTGQTGPDGNKDIQDIDEGTSNMIRQIWNANELTTDEAECTWGDAGIPEFNHNTWGDSHPMMQALYYRLMFGVTISNYFLSQATGTDATTRTERAEVRFMRALYYYYMMDLYGNPPMVTTMDNPQPKQATRLETFNFVESELKAILGENSSDNADLLADAPVSYGRASKAAANLLLARIYINAKVYTGTERWNDAKTYAQKVISDSNFSLLTTGSNGYSAYQLIFMGDNDTNGAQKEIILPAIHDGVTTQTWAGCLFIIASTSNGDMLKDYPTGTTENWGGNHCRQQFAQQFFPNNDAVEGIPTAVAKAANDDRALFYTKGRKPAIEDESSFTSGYSYVKFLNKHSDGSQVHHTQFVDTDFPMLRMAEAYLIYAEADARINGGSCTTDGLAKLNALRTRANAKSFTSADLDVLCSEWSREFGFEGMRRTTLVRFNKYGGQSSYKWQWEGGAENGQSFDAHYNIFAIPASDLNANSNLKQNTGY